MNRLSPPQLQLHKDMQGRLTILHIKRAAFQSVCIWGQETTICQIETKSLAYWGWKKQDDMWQMFLTVLPPIAQSVLVGID
jgi:hypothetical protein